MLAHAHIMKTAGQTLCDILRQSFPGRHCDIKGSPILTAREFRFARKFYPRLKSIAGHCVRPCCNLEQADCSVRYFTFLREPVARCISHYQFMVQKAGLKQDFDTWVRTSAANYQTKFLSRSKSAENAIEILNAKVGFVGMVDRFNESLVLLQRWADEPRLNIRYRSRNIAADNRIKQQILADPEKLAAIVDRNQEDIKLYRYAKQVIYARQVADYGPGLAADVQSFEASLPAPRRISLSITLASAKRDLFYKPAARLCLRNSTAKSLRTTSTEAKPDRQKAA